jgi:uncharacterized membrane protein YebE (DUF533 family)
MHVMKWLSVVGLVVAMPAFAQSTPGIDQRQENQQRRIDKGVESGALTPKEAERMEKGQARVQAKEDAARADGVVTKKERAQVHRAQNKQSARIYRQKHDRQTDRNRDGKKD